MRHPLKAALVLGLLLGWGWVALGTLRPPADPLRIVVTEDGVAHARADLVSRMGREPTLDELRAAVAADVREEILYRHARLTGTEGERSLVLGAVEVRTELLARAEATRIPIGAETVDAYIALRRDRYAALSMPAARALAEADARREMAAGAADRRDREAAERFRIVFERAAVRVGGIAVGPQANGGGIAVAPQMSMGGTEVAPQTSAPAIETDPQTGVGAIEISEGEAGRLVLELAVPIAETEVSSGGVAVPLGVVVIPSSDVGSIPGVGVPGVQVPDGCRETAPAQGVRWAAGTASRREVVCPEGELHGRVFTVEGVHDQTLRFHTEFRLRDGSVRSALLEPGVRSFVLPPRPWWGASIGSGVRKGFMEAIGFPSLWLLALVTGLAGGRARLLLGAVSVFALSHFGARRLVAGGELVMAPEIAPLLLAAAALLPALDVAAGKRSPRTFFAPHWLFAAMIGAAVGAGISPSPALPFFDPTTAFQLGVALSITAWAVLFGGVGFVVRRARADAPLPAPVAVAIGAVATGLLVAHAAAAAALLRAAGVGAPLVVLGAAVLIGVGRLPSGLDAGRPPAGPDPGRQPSGLDLGRLPVAAFLLSFALGTGVEPSWVEPAWSRALVLGSLFLLAFTLGRRIELPPPHGLLLFGVVAFASGWQLRHAAAGPFGISPGGMGGLALAGAVLVFAGGRIAELLPDRDRRRAATGIGVGAALLIVGVRLGEYTLSAARELPRLAESPAGLPVPLLSLLLLAVALVLWPRRRRVADALGLDAPPRRLHVAALACAFFLIPLGSVRIAGGDSGAGVGSVTAREVATLLENTYHAFNLRDEEELYDRLAESVTQELVRTLYLDSRRRLRAGTVEGDEVTVREVALLELTPASGEPSAGADSPAFTARWRVTARVRHLEHTHQRENLYSGTLRLRRETDGWKLEQIQLIGDDRIIVPSELP